MTITFSKFRAKNLTWVKEQLKQGSITITSDKYKRNPALTLILTAWGEEGEESVNVGVVREKPLKFLRGKVYIDKDKKPFAKFSPVQFTLSLQLLYAT